MKVVNGRGVPEAEKELRYMGDLGTNMESILTEAANMLGGTIDQDALKLDATSGNSLEIAGTPTNAILISTTAQTVGLGIGSSGTNMVLDAVGERAIEVYTTYSGTDGSTSSRPIYMYNTMTGAGAVGGRAEFYTTANVALGGWSNALKGYFEWGNSGRSAGLGSAVCCEMKLPSATISSGAYFPLEIEMVDQANTSYAGHFGYLYANITGTKTNFDANGVFFWLDGLTAGATKLLSLTSQTLKCKVAAAATARYLVLSQMEDGLGLGNSTTAMTLTTYANQAVKIYTTCASTDASNSVEPFYLKSTMTGANGVGGRSRFHLYTNVALGGWSNALKGYAEYGTSGKTTGLGSAVCAEMLLSAGTTSGTYAPLESELVADSEVSSGTATSFLYMNIAGSNSTGKTTLNTNGYLFELGAGVVDTANGMFDAQTVASCAATHKLRIRIGGVDYYIPLNTALNA